MRHSKFRQIAVTGALALIATIPLAACADPSVSPRPAEAAENLAASSPTPDTTPSASGRAANAAADVARQPTGQRPTKTRTARPHSPKPTATKPTGTCYGAVR